VRVAVGLHEAPWNITPEEFPNAFNGRESESGLWILRCFDGFDHRWFNISGPLPKQEAFERWLKETKDGTKNTTYGDIDYYALYPDDTRMMRT
jgi:hypothetical protein